MLNTECTVCNLYVNIPINKHCGHVCCFLCYMETSLDGEKDKCKVCGSISDLSSDSVTTDNDFNDNSNYLWLYSSNYNDTWWIFNKVCNEYIETIYQDYKQIKNLNTNDHDQINDEQIQIEVNIPKSSKKYKIPKIIKNEYNMEVFTEFEFDGDCEELQFENEEPLKLQKPHICGKNNKDTIDKHLPYVININNQNYKIDFDMMKQININDLSKKRNIKRLTVDNNLNHKNIYQLIHYLKNEHQIIGLYGQKFDNNILNE